MKDNTLSGSNFKYYLSPELNNTDNIEDSKLPQETELPQFHHMKRTVTLNKSIKLQPEPNFSCTW